MGGKYSVRPPDEDAIWQSEMSLKGASRGRGHEVPCPRHVYRGTCKTPKGDLQNSKERLQNSKGRLAKLQRETTKL
ncbi:MAG: hypothetical protein ACM3JI_02075 [Anaerolineae bacterium]